MWMHASRRVVCIGSGATATGGVAGMCVLLLVRSKSVFIELQAVSEEGAAWRDGRECVATVQQRGAAVIKVGWVDICCMYLCISMACALCSVRLCEYVETVQQRGAAVIKVGVVVGIWGTGTAAGLCVAPRARVLPQVLACSHALAHAHALAANRDSMRLTCTACTSMTCPPLQSTHCKTCHRALLTHTVCPFLCCSAGAWPIISDVCRQQRM